MAATTFFSFQPPSSPAFEKKKIPRLSFPASIPFSTNLSPSEELSPNKKTDQATEAQFHALISARRRQLPRLFWLLFLSLFPFITPVPFPNPLPKGTYDISLFLSLSLSRLRFPYFFLSAQPSRPPSHPPFFTVVLELHHRPSSHSPSFYFLSHSPPWLLSWPTSPSQPSLRYSCL